MAQLRGEHQTLRLFLGLLKSLHRYWSNLRSIIEAEVNFFASCFITSMEIA